MIIDDTSVSGSGRFFFLPTDHEKDKWFKRQKAVFIVLSTTSRQQVPGASRRWADYVTRGPCLRHRNQRQLPRTASNTLRPASGELILRPPASSTARTGQN